ncbi:KICSTOR complex protein kaptin-like isoform X3 [Metopolophium dirhodum]|uniref:KICSTOR complex protein kaptin-like isoform X3 n=1 Tax=Metopolophium dirhodum TaxID=44670 RepID=UPI0029906B2A|nr:KICSTOR complex protein kaptin-like isoform X3 [Metopolophium dirhodum]
MDGLVQSVVYDTSSPANIYSATVMQKVDGDQKIVMIASKKDMITLESKIIDDKVETSIVELNFSNIPNNAEIISIHCINRCKEYDDFVFGITYALIVEDEEPETAETYLNIYSGFPGSSLEAIMESCKTLKLDFVPFQLNHAIYMSELQKNGMWLLSGSDKKIHAYKIEEQEILEQKVEEYFIEFEDTKDSIVLCFGTKSFSNYKKRLSYYGCETGYSMLAIVDSGKNQILHCFLERYESPITVMQLFNIHKKTVDIDNILSAVKDDFIPDCDTVDEKEQVCLLVGSAVESAVVYMNVLKNDLRNAITLTDSNRHQAIVCALITDVNFDSKNEILLGTYGNYILNYVYENNNWVEQQQFDMRDPVYTICYLDIVGEGVNDVVVMSERGIHILKHEPRYIVEVLKNRLKL